MTVIYDFHERKRNILRNKALYERYGISFTPSTDTFEYGFILLYSQANGMIEFGLVKRDLDNDGNIYKVQMQPSGEYSIDEPLAAAVIHESEIVYNASKTLEQNISIRAINDRFAGMGLRTRLHALQELPPA